MARKKSAIDDRTLGFDWDLVRSFLAVLDTGSLLGAARRLSSSQPTIGRHIEAIESQLGLVLFERTGRGLTPTGNARLIAEQARLMQRGAEQLSRVAAGSDQLSHGLVRISVSRVIAEHLMPQVIASLQEESPDIHIAVVASDNLSNLLQRDADIAVRMVRPTQSGLIARRIGEIRIVPCASRDYLDRWGTPKNVLDLLNHRLIGADTDEDFVRQFSHLCKLAGVDPSAVRLSFRCDDFATQIAGVKAGLGVGFCASYVIHQFPEIVTLPLDLNIDTLPVWLVVHREIRTSPRIRRVFDYLGVAMKAHFK